MVKVHKVILCHLGCVHQVSDDSGIDWNIDTKSIFNTTYRSKSMHRSTNTADTFGKCPGIPGIASLENHLNATPHRTAAVGIFNDITVIQLCFYS